MKSSTNHGAPSSTTTSSSPSKSSSDVFKGARSSLCSSVSHASDFSPGRDQERSEGRASRVDEISILEKEENENNDTRASIEELEISGKSLSSDASRSSKTKVKKVLSFKESCHNHLIEDEKKNKEEEMLVTLRKRGPINDDSLHEQRMSYIMKTKGTLYYKKKGTFSKWKIFFVLLDDYKMQMNFFKSQDDYEKLAGCKMVIDLRFFTEIKPKKQKFLQGNFPFKILRRAGLSTLKLASSSEEERAKWLSTIEGIIKKIKIMSAIDYISDEKRASTLPNNSRAYRTSSDSDATTSASVPDRENFIHPKKISGSGFKLDSSQIASIKLKRVSSERNSDESSKLESSVSTGGNDETFDLKKRFGVKLRRVQTEKEPRRKEIEQNNDYNELKEKFNSLSLTKINRSPKLPFKENLAHTYKFENTEIQNNNPNVNTYACKSNGEISSRRTPSPKIPISKSIENVLKTKDNDERLPMVRDDQISKLNLCHAISSELQYDETTCIDNKDGSSNALLKKYNNENFKACLIEPVDFNELNLNSREINRENTQKTITDPINRKTKSVEALITPGGSVVCQYKDEEQQNLGEVYPEQNFTDNILTITDSNSNDDQHDRGKKHKAENENFEEKLQDIFRENIVDGNSKSTNATQLNTSEEKKIILLENNNSLEVERDQRHKTRVKMNEIDHYSEKETNIARMMSQNQIDFIIAGKEVPKECANNVKSDIITLDPKVWDDIRFSIHSFQSQTSTESDEPLPRLNFLGKGDRCSTGSFIMKEILALKSNKNRLSSSDESLLKNQNDIALYDINSRVKNKNVINLNKCSGSSSQLNDDSISSCNDKCNESKMNSDVKENREMCLMESSIQPRNDINLKFQCKPKYSSSIIKNNLNGSNEKEAAQDSKSLTDIVERHSTTNAYDTEDLIKTSLKKNISKFHQIKEIIENNQGNSDIAEERIKSKVSNNDMSISDNILFNSNVQVKSFLIKTEEEPAVDNVISNRYSHSHSESELAHSSQSLKEKPFPAELNTHGNDSFFLKDCGRDDIIIQSKMNNDASSYDQSGSANISNHHIKISIKDELNEKNCCSPLHVEWYTSNNNEIEANIFASNLDHCDGKTNITLNQPVISVCDNNLSSEITEVNTATGDLVVHDELRNECEKNSDETKDKNSFENDVIQKTEAEHQENADLEEVQDYFPQYGGTSYRQRGEHASNILAKDLRTSGITSLQKFLEENKNEGIDGNSEIKSGINKLGFSSAIEKLKNEMA